jgi:signal transduction histidine kinase
MYQYVAEEKKISLNLKTSNQLFAAVDPDRISQALANIIDNAIKYSLVGGQIDIEIYLSKGNLVIQIKDTGIGILGRDLPRIWDRLFRGDQSRTQKGLGLGLSLVKAIIQAHKGHVEVSSAPETGSTFTIFLPTIH